MTAERCDEFIDTFSTTEKILNRIGFFGAFVFGAVAIFLESAIAGFIYTGILILSLFLITRVFFCAYCSYPNKHNTCLFFPLSIVQRKSPRFTKRMTNGDKLGAFIILIACIGFPQYWLWKYTFLFISFWIATIAVAKIVNRYYCTRCRYIHCPLNRAITEST